MSSVVLLAFLVPLGLLASSLAEGRALDGARQDAQRVAAFAGETAERSRLEAEVLAVNAGARRTTAFLADSTQVGEPASRDAAVELAALGRAFTARADGGAEVLVPVGGAGGVAVVRTFVPDAELSAGVRETWLVLGGVGLLLLGATVLAGDRIARRLARSTLDLSGVADRLGAGDLTARVTPSGPPEIAGVGRVLNGLGARVGQLLAAERELVADLSHRLRTPITALRLDVDLLEDAEERDRMAGHVDELVRAVDAVVWIARHPAEEAPSGGCDAGAVVAGRARFWSVLAADQGRDLRVDVPDGVLRVPVSASELGAGVDVLVDNVFSHTPEGTAFALAVRVADDVIEVAVVDEGPGFATMDLVERGRSGAGSTGLGMDVARRTAERAGGRLVIAAGATGGARIALELPRA
jgi:signal transduction histidine kinase